MDYIAFDSHKRYTLASVEDGEGGMVMERRIEHDRGAIRGFLSQWEPGTPVAVETIGNWYWIVDEIEEAGMMPRLVHARKAKLMMGMINKTDKLDARGMNRLQRNDTLPTVWIPPKDIRDKRDLPRTRMALTRECVRLKNRIHATLAKYALKIDGASDIFGAKAQAELQHRIQQLPAHTRFSTERLLEQLNVASGHVRLFERRIEEVFDSTPEMELVKTIPGIGMILGVVILLEIGDVRRFASAPHLASYAGTTPRVHSSGGKTRYGQLRSDVNRYLKWAFAEAANVICLNRRRWPRRHVAELYERIRSRKGHQKAIGAVARHLAEATFFILSKAEPYREPKGSLAPSMEG